MGHARLGEARPRRRPLRDDSVGYPKASILRALVVSDAGGDTLWANAVTAYPTLPEPLRALVDGLRAVHSNLYN